MSFEKPTITRDDLKTLRKFLKKNCPGLKITTGRGGWWRMTYVYGGGELSRFTEEEKQFLTQIGLLPCTGFLSINMYQAEKILEEVRKA